MADNNERCLNIIERIFSNWTALRMAVEHGMGSTEQARNFCEYVAEILRINEKLDQLDLAAELEDYMDAEFHTQLEDDSEKQVAEEIHRLHYLLLNDVEKLDSEILKLPEVKPWIVKKTETVRKVLDEAEGNDDEDDEGTNVPRNKMEVDDDGFALVTRKRR
ncbi:TSR2, 20S rRNA accumulation, homolog [Nasonia vitripennis]|uniref:Pre-rRNA-processing protein TSR2 homolog n=1 Tax=Nasonia vitripennis TaxID=7425 RepID=A0A7M6UR68_NASVI|nr:TSR2, 20S rRNA accumulation, homolog [Nasonia vitripennis]